MNLKFVAGLPAAELQYHGLPVFSNVEPGRPVYELYAECPSTFILKKVMPFIPNFLIHTKYSRFPVIGSHQWNISGLYSTSPVSSSVT